MSIKFCMSYSCGKDSALALSKMIDQGHDPVALIVNVNGDLDRSWFHGVSNQLLHEISDSLGIPVIQSVSGANGEGYEENFIQALEKCKAMGAVGCCFGDIDILQHREWNEKVCKASGLKMELPLWQSNRYDITMEFIEKGFKATIKTITKSFGLPVELLGKDLNGETVKRIMELGADPCGENGEYHTLTYDGPIFRFPIEFQNLGIYESPYSYSLHLEKK